MKTALLLMVLVIGPVHGEDWKATDGKVYQDVKVLKVEPDAVTVMDKTGGGLVALATLPPDLQKRFNYDPAKGQEAAAARAASDSQNAQDLAEEANQAEALKQQRIIADETNRQAELKGFDAEKGSYQTQSRNGRDPVAAPRPAPTAEDAQVDAEWKAAQAVRKEDEANGCAHVSGKVIQVLPEGFIGNLITRWGVYDAAFVKCNSNGMFDGQSWSGIVVPNGTFQYENALGALATIPSLSVNLKLSSNVP
jgi:hypothetical protein